jgi:hypothetical protein
MTIITCQGCGARVETQRRSRKWCPACWGDKLRAWQRARQRRYYARHHMRELERMRRWRAANYENRREERTP